MNIALGIVAVLVVVAVLLLSTAVRVLREYERGVVFRLGRLLPGPKGPGLILLIPFGIDKMVKTELRTITLAIPPQEVITQGQRPGARDRRHVLPRRRPAGGRDADRELPRRDLADRADDAALGARPAFARRTARRARQDQRDPAGHHRRAHGALGHQDLGRRGQGRRAADDDAARDGPPGRGRARAARQDHRRAGRVRSRRAAEHRGRPHLREPDRAPAALPPDAARDLVAATTRRRSCRSRSTSCVRCRRP